MHIAICSAIKTRVSAVVCRQNSCLEILKLFQKDRFESQLFVSIMQFVFNKSYYFYIYLNLSTQLELL